MVLQVPVTHDVKQRNEKITNNVTSFASGAHRKTHLLLFFIRILLYILLIDQFTPIFSGFNESPQVVINKILSIYHEIWYGSHYIIYKLNIPVNRNQLSS